MSYILDALKKSEMQARQGELPSIHSSHTLPGHASRRPGWHYVLSGIAAACVLFALAGILLPSATDKTLPTVLPASDVQTGKVQAVTQQAAPAAPATASSLPVTGTRIPGPQLQTNPPATTPEAATTVTQETLAPPPQEEPAQAASITPTSGALVQAEKPAALPMPDFQPAQSAALPAPLRSKLPVSVQEALPPIDISGHIYDDKPSARMVFINGHIQREGDMLASGLQLLSITARGVELSFRDTPFRIELFPVPAQRGN